MSIEQRVIASSKRSVGGIREGRGGPTAAAAEPEAKKKRKKPSKLVLIIAAVVILAVAGGAYFFLLKPAGGSTPAPPPAPVPGKVLTIPAVSVNLAAGRYLRLGLGLQLTADVGEKAPDPAKALDLAIGLFSGRTIAEVSDPKVRENLKVELARQLSKAYDGEVMDVYLTDYVTQ